MASRRKWGHPIAAAVAPFLVAGLAACGALSLGEMQTEDEASAAQEHELIRVVTCWAGLPLMEELAAAFLSQRPDLFFDLEAVDSQQAEERLRRGQAELALVIRPYNPASGQALLQEDDRELAPTLLALDALGIAVHERNPLGDLPAKEVARLFEGYYLDWSLLGGTEGRPELLTREAGATTRELLEHTLMDGESVSSAARVMPHDRGILAYIREHELAIGYVSRAWAQGREGSGIKLVAIDGVAPLPTALRRGTYPLTYALVLLRSPQAPSAIQPFIDFCLQPQTRRLNQARYVLPQR
ncbi:MAG: substrate-binding domain-containing protein [Chloroflexi bacterium]|nr:substrate-binding domain-containing protein [Chloroflexota bacterium]